MLKLEVQRGRFRLAVGIVLVVVRSTYDGVQRAGATAWLVGPRKWGRGTVNYGRCTMVPRRFSLRVLETSPLHHPLRLHRRTRHLLGGCCVQWPMIGGYFCGSLVVPCCPNALTAPSAWPQGLPTVLLPTLSRLPNLFILRRELPATSHLMTHKCRRHGCLLLCRSIRPECFSLIDRDSCLPVTDRQTKDGSVDDGLPLPQGFN